MLHGSRKSEISKRKNLRWMSLFVLHTFPYVDFSLWKVAFKMCFNLAFPLFFFWTIFMSNLPYTFICRTWYSHKIFVPVEVSSTDGDFDIFGKKFQNINFDFGTFKTLILRARSIFLKGGHPTKIWSKYYFSWKPCQS